MQHILIPILMLGLYSFKDDVVPVGRLTIDVVDSRMPDAAARIQAFKRDGSLCQAVAMGQTRCVRTLPASAVPQASLDYVRAHRAGAGVMFYARSGDPVLVRQSETGSEWLIPQRGVWSGGEFSQFRYMVSREGVIKMEIPGRDASAPLWLVLEKDHTLRHGETVPWAEGRFRTQMDSVEIVLRR